MTVWNAVVGAVACDYGAEREMCVCGRIIVDEFLSFRGRRTGRGMRTGAAALVLRWLLRRGGCGGCSCAGILNVL